MRRQAVLVFAMVILVLAASPVAGAIIDSINADQDPVDFFTWGYLLGYGSYVNEVGWVYTPELDFTMTGILTKFGYVRPDSPPIFGPDPVVEVYDGPPVNGGVRLRSSTLDVYPLGEFIGVSFEPLDVIAGEDYFIGFRNICEHTLNSSTSGVALSCYGEISGTPLVSNGTYPDAINHNAAIHPVLQFEGVPEPATLFLFGLGAIALRKRRT